MVCSSACRKLWLEHIPGRPLLVLLFPGLLMGPLLMLYAALALQGLWLGLKGPVCTAFACPCSIGLLAPLEQICCKDEGGRPGVMPSASHAGLSARAMTEGMTLCPCNTFLLAKRLNC